MSGAQHTMMQHIQSPASARYGRRGTSSINAEQALHALADIVAPYTPLYCLQGLAAVRRPVPPAGSPLGHRHIAHASRMSGDKAPH